MNTRLAANERPRQCDDAQVRHVRAQAVQHSFHPERSFRASGDPESALWIGGETAQDERASSGKFPRETHECVELSDAIGEARQR
jgi:hypothetical protein